MSCNLFQFLESKKNKVFGTFAGAMELNSAIKPIVPLTYQDTIDYLTSQLPMYQRIGKAAYKADLQNTIDLCNILGNPQNSFWSIHIAGTNGKGSVAHMLASVLQVSGLKVGLYTSPHYRDFRERIRINGEKIPKQVVCDFVEKHKKAFEDISPSFFEMTVGMAFDHFAADKVDVAILETGMGGRLDSTNVVTPDLSIITNIGYDHTVFLGDTLEKIAAEKAGIIKQEVPVVIGERKKETEGVFVNIADQINAPLYFADGPDTDINYDMSLVGGDYQKENIKTLLKSIDVLKQMDYSISDESVKEGIEKVVPNTGFMGRWQTLAEDPLTICDAAHNAEGFTKVLRQIKDIKYKDLHFVFGTVADKELATVLPLFPKNAFYYFCKPDIPRGMEVDELSRNAASWGLKGEAYGSVNEALEAARLLANANDLIFIGGSSFVVAEVV